MKKREKESRSLVKCAFIINAKGNAMHKGRVPYLETAGDCLQTQEGC